jgi:Na+/melibiose symporter-like transporter
MVIVSLGNYFAKYILGDLNYYMIFAAVLGVSQLLALAIAPTLSKKLGRKKLCTLGTFLMVLGFVIYLFPLDNIIFTIIAGFIAFGGQGFLQMVMYASVQDTVEYGELKNGQKNEAITISVLSFINKASAGIAIGITSIILIISGIGDIDINEEVQTVLTSGQKMTFRIGMFGLPMILIVLGYVMYNILFKIDEKKHDEIMLQLKLKKESKTSSSDDTIL